MIRRTIICHLVLAAIFAGPRCVANAADPTEILIKQGVELRRAGRNQDALEKFRLAYDQTHGARASAQLGLCELALNNWIEADLHLAEALVSMSDPWVSRNRAALQHSLGDARAKLAVVKIVSGPAVAEVRVNDQFLGPGGDSKLIRVLPGPVHVEANARGYLPFMKEFQVVEGQEVDITLDMLPEPSPAPRLQSASHQPNEKAEAVLTQSGETSPPPRPLYARSWFWVTAGIVVSAGIVAALLATRSSTDGYARVDQTRSIPQ